MGINRAEFLENGGLSFLIGEQQGYKRALGKSKSIGENLWRLRGIPKKKSLLNKFVFTQDSSEKQIPLKHYNVM